MMRTRLLGAGVVALGILATITVKVWIIDPVLVPKPNGNMGELYGPVIYFRPYIYGTLGAVIFIGILLMVLGGQRSNAN